MNGDLCKICEVRTADDAFVICRKCAQAVVYWMSELEDFNSRLESSEPDPQAADETDSEE